jgi:hypothetical protein
VSRERGQHLFGLRAVVSLARLLVARGQAGAARPLLREARSRVDDDPTVLDIAAADRTLARLRDVA